MPEEILVRRNCVGPFSPLGEPPYDVRNDLRDIHPIHLNVIRPAIHRDQTSAAQYVLTRDIC